MFNILETNEIVIKGLLFDAGVGVLFFEGEGRTLATGFFNSCGSVVFDLFDLRIISSNPSSVRKAVLHATKKDKND